MKRKGQVFILLVAAVIFSYLLLVDYPATLRSATSDLVVKEKEQVKQEKQDSKESKELKKEEKPSDVSTLETKDPVKTVLLVNNINEGVYSQVYPVFKALGCTGSVLFDDGDLTGNFSKMTNEQFLEMVNAGWGFVLSGIKVEESTKGAWKAKLDKELERIQKRAGVRPVTYYFKAGEYSPEKEAVLQEEQFTAIYYSKEDEEVVSRSGGGLKRIAVQSYETDVKGFLEQVHSRGSVAITVNNGGNASGNEGQQWQGLLEALKGDYRFRLISQAEWINAA